MARKGRNIYKRKDGRWEGRYQVGRKPDGRIRYASVYGKSYRETKDLMEQRIAVHMSIPPSSAGALTIKDLMEKWLFFRSAEVKGSTYQRYDTLIKLYIIPHLGDIRIRYITAEDLISFTKSLQTSGRCDGQGGLSDKTVNSIICMLRSALKMAVQQYGIGEHILYQVKAPPVSKKKIEILDENECEALVRQILAEPNMRYFSFLLALSYGLRLGEVCGLKWSDIDFERRTLSVNRTVLRLNTTGKSQLTLQTPKTESSARTIPLEDKLLELLKSLGNDWESDAFILTASNTKPMDPRTLEESFHSFLRKHGLQQHAFHSLRHTFATRAIERGFDAKAVSELLGHNNVKTTLDLYVHPSISHKREIVEAISLINADSQCTRD